MKKIFILFFALLLCFPISASATDTADSFHSGDGSQDNPYIISSIGELLKLAEDVNSGNDYVNTYFELGDNIDLSEIDNWTPIGNDSDMSNNDFDGTPFNGKLDGKGHSIKGLKISHGLSDHTYNFQGLFGCIGKNGSVSNLTVDGSVKCSHNAGMLAAQNNGTIDRVYISGGYVNARYSIGGLVSLNNGTIKNSYTGSNLEVIADGCFVGGIAGENIGSVLNCYNSAIVTSNINKDNNFAQGNAWAGCIVGSGGTVKNTYSSTEINVPNNPKFWGQLMGDGKASESYYAEGLTNPSNIGIEKSEDEMKTTLASLLNANLKDIEDETLYLWEQSDSYPYLTNKLWAKIPCVNQVVIQEYPNEIGRGNKVADTEFSYDLDYEYLRSDQIGITFSIVSKEHAEGTKFVDKTLYIDRNEPQNSITVRLTSDFDCSKYAEVNINLINPKYYGYPEIKAVENIENGTSLDKIILPNMIRIYTNFGQEYVSVAWNKDSVSYDKSSTESQEFTINGVITLPDYMDINGGSTDVQITVKVNAAETKPEIQTGGVSGIVMDYNNHIVKGIKVKLTKGATNSNTIVETQTDQKGEYTFINVPNGVYSLVATRGKQIVTKTIVIDSQSITQDMKLPNDKINTTLVVKGATTPLVAVDRLDEIIETPVKDTDIKLVVEKKADEQAVGKDKIEEQLTNGEKVGIFLDAQLLKFENGKETEKITELDSGKKIKITIEIPEELRGKQSYSVIRHHEDLAEKLDCSYNEKMSTITFETDKFSTYALVYKEVDSTDNSNHKSHKKSSIKTNVIDEKDSQEKIISPEIVFPFQDISKNNWAYDAINYVYANGIMNGISKSKFGPNFETTRAMLVKVIWSIEGESVAKNKSSFKDLKKGSYYENAVDWAVENDIVKGYSEDKFAPNDILTREQVAVILYRYSNYKKKQDSLQTDLSYYKDVDKISDWAKEGVQWAVDKKILEGREENLIFPTDNTKRSELAKIIMVFLKNSKENKI